MTSPATDPPPIATTSEGCASGECDPSLPPADRWRAAVEKVKEESPRHGRSLAFARVVAMRDGEVLLAFPKDAGLHRATVTGSGRVLIEKALGGFFGRPTRLAEDSTEAALAQSPLSIAEQELKGRQSRERDLDSKVRGHPAVKSVLKIIGGQIEHVQVLEPEERDRPADEPAE